MNLVKCPDCGNEINYNIKRCPYCGHKNKFKTKKTFGILSIIFAIIYLIFSWMPLFNLLLCIFGILSLIFSIVSLSNERPKVIGLIGLILTILDIVLVVGSYWEPIPSKAKLLKEATYLDWHLVYDTVANNPAKAEDYEGKYYKFHGKVENIESDYCVLSDTGSCYGYHKYINVYLSSDELKKLNDGKEITVIGKLKDIEDDASFNPAILLDE